MASGRYGTNFLETEALLAMQSDDRAHAERQLAQMTDVELRTFLHALRKLSRLAEFWADAGGVEL